VLRSSVRPNLVVSLTLSWSLTSASLAQAPATSADTASSPPPAELGPAHVSPASDPQAALAMRAEYKQITDAAIAEFEAGRFAEARALFLRAHALMPSARTLRTLGMTAFELRSYPQALVELQGSLDEARRPLEPKQRAQVAALIERTRDFVGSYRLRVSPSTAELWLDGAPLAREPEGELVLAVGAHELRVRAPGYQELRRAWLVQGREQAELTFELMELQREVAAPVAVAPAAPLLVVTPKAPEPPVITPVAAPVPRVDSSRDVRAPLAWSALSLGAAGVVVGAVMGGLALQRQRTVEDHCPNQVCAPTYGDDLKQWERFADAATAGVVVGAVGLGLGTYLWIAARRAQRNAAVIPRLRFGATGLAGSF
jgi:tetratricopeptide (TPR) repeat protein